MKIVGAALIGAFALGGPPGWTEARLPTPGSTPSGLAWGYDGNVYGVEFDRNRFFRMEGDIVTREWPIPTLKEAIPVVAVPGRILAGADDGIAVLDTRRGTVGEIPLPGISVTGFAVDRATNTVYFTDARTGAIERLAGTKAVPVAVLRVSTHVPCVPSDLVFQQRTRDIYVDCQRGDEIWRVSHAGAKRAYHIPVPDSLPGDLVLGPDGKVYVSLVDTGAVAQLDPATGRVRTWSAPGGSNAGGLAFDTSGRLWFALPSRAAVEQLSPETGSATVYALPSGGEPISMARGPYAELLYSNAGTNAVGVFTPPPETDAGQRVFTRDFRSHGHWPLRAPAPGRVTVDVLEAPGTVVTLATPGATRTLNLDGHQRWTVASRPGANAVLTFDVQALEPQTVAVRIAPAR